MFLFLFVQLNFNISFINVELYVSLKLSFFPLNTFAISMVDLLSLCFDIFKVVMFHLVYQELQFSTTCYKIHLFQVRLIYYRRISDYL